VAVLAPIRFLRTHFTTVLTADEVILDPSRVAAQVVSGIGFIGAGLIFIEAGATFGFNDCRGNLGYGRNRPTIIAWLPKPIVEDNEKLYEMNVAFRPTKGVSAADAA
jgi:hypothetical protein